MTFESKRLAFCLFEPPVEVGGKVILNRRLKQRLVENVVNEYSLWPRHSFPPFPAAHITSYNAGFCGPAEFFFI